MHVLTADGGREGGMEVGRMEVGRETEMDLMI